MKLEQTRSADCVSNLMFDRKLANELSVDEVEELERHIKECQRCTSKLTELKDFKDGMAVDAANFRLSTPSVFANVTWLTKYRSQWAVATSLSAAAAVLIFVSMHHPARSPATRTKGVGAHAAFFITHNGVMRRAESGQTVYPADALQITYSLTQPQFLAVIGADRDHTTVYFPTESDHALRVNAGQSVPLPHSIVFDDVGDIEKIYVLFCQHPLEIDTARRALDGDANLKRIVGCSVETMELKKSPKNGMQ